MPPLRYFYTYLRFSRWIAGRFKQKNVNFQVVYFSSQKNYKQRSAATFLILMTIGWLVIMTFIAANQEASEKIIWIIQFSQTLFQDLVITPLISLLWNFLVFRILKRVDRKKLKLKQILKKTLAPAFMQLFFLNNSIEIRKDISNNKTKRIDKITVFTKKTPDES